MKFVVKLKPKQIVDKNWWVDNLIVAALYFIICYLVLNLPQSLLGSPVFPSAGIAVGALLARGRSRCFGVFLGATLNSLFIVKGSFFYSVVSGIIPAAGAFLSTTLIFYFNRTNYFLNDVKKFVTFIIVIAFSGTLLQALAGTFNAMITGLIPSQIYWDVAWSWWVGDAIGVLVFAPLVLAWWNKRKTNIDISNISSANRLDDYSKNQNISLNTDKSIVVLDNKVNLKELIVTLVMLALISFLSLSKGQSVEYLLLLPLLWSSLRFDAKTTTLLVTVIATIAAVTTAYKVGIFYKVAQETNSLLLLQLFMGVISITAIAVLALVTENNQTAKKLQEQVFLIDQAYTQLDQVNKTLEDAIASRTKELLIANQEINSLNQKLTLENSRMSTELAITRKLQEIILPKPRELNGIAELEIVGFMAPADEVGGDYYDVLQQGDHIKIGIGDVTGHGLESGVIMIMVQTAIRTLLINGETDSIKFLSTINQTIYKNIQRMGSDKNLSLVLIDYYDRTLSLSGQHESVIVARHNGKMEIIDTDALGFPIGLTPEITEFIFEVKIDLQLGDVVVLYTDGITEAENIYKQRYGLNRLSELVNQIRHRDIDQIREIVIADVKQFIGSHKVYDDITLVVLKRKI